MKKALSIILILLVIFFATGVDEYQWNDGKCPCGGKWELMDAERGRETFTRYYHKCIECNDTIELIFPLHNR